MTSTIVHVHGRQILDSRGNPTVEVEVGLDSGAVRPRGRAVRRVDRRARGGRAARRRRARLARQGRVEGGRATSTASSPTCSPAWTPTDQRELDTRWSTSTGRPNKSRLGANAILGCSLAAAKAAAEHAGVSLYRWIGGTNAHACCPCRC